MLQIISMGDVLQDCLSRFPKIDSLKPEQIEALQSLLAGDDVLAILPTGFGKSFIYQVFCLAKQSSNPNASVLVISPLNSIVEEQVRELTKLGLPAIHLKENDSQCMADISQRKFFCSAERCLSKEFQDLLKSTHEGPEIEMVVVDESHTVKCPAKEHNTVSPARA